MADIEQRARELLAAEYAMAGSTKRADKIIAGFDCAPGTEYALRAIAAALRAAPEGFPDGWHLSERATCYVLSEGNNIVGNFVGPDAEQNAARVAQMLAAAPDLSTVKPPRDLRTRLREEV